MPYVKFKAKRYGYKDNEMEEHFESIDWYRVNVPYFALVFKNDVVQFEEDIRHVYVVNTRTKCKQYCKRTDGLTNKKYSSDVDWVKSSALENQEIEINVNTRDTGLGGYDIKRAILYKRPFLNWLKYIFVLITGRYIK